MLLLFTEGELMQAATLVSVQPITSLFAKSAALYVGEFDPTFTPFRFHWKVGLLPPAMVLATKETREPGHKASLFVCAIETIGVTKVITETGMVLLNMLATVAHDALLVISQVIISPLFRLEAENVALLVPTFILSLFH